MINKSCKKCFSKEVKKDGKMRGKQRYRCKSCWYVFQNKTRVTNDKNIREEYSDKKQTYKQVSISTWLNIRTIQRRMDRISIKKKKLAKEMLFY